MRKKKFDKDLLNEEVSKFKMMSEYSFYEDRSEPELDNDEEIILGSQIFNEEEEEEIEEDPFGGEEVAPEAEGDEEPSEDEEELLFSSCPASTAAIYFLIANNASIFTFLFSLFYFYPNSGLMFND